MKKISIRSIYAGKPDAKDIIDFEGTSELLRTFIVPSNINLDNLLEGNHCYITGYKGTGKTALLFYLDNYYSLKDNASCSSFIFFKEEFTDTKKTELEVISKRILSSIIIEKQTLIENTDFEYIWRWLFYKRIISDNNEFSGGLFLNNESWQNFEKIISRIKGPSNNKKSIIPPKIKLGIPYADPNTGITIKPEIEVDFQNKKEESNFSKFTSLIDEADKEFVSVTRTDVPYHIFIDELEAYYGDESVFKRDLYLIRDLIFTVKRFNSIFSVAKMKNTKVICSIRSEIINAITRFIVTKELNKVTSGFEIPLIWNYSNTNSFNHPIMQILLRRIAISECEEGEPLSSDKDIAQRWFPEKIHKIDPTSYILNNSWCKPRDIVRLILASQNCIHSDSNQFSQAVFSACTKKYSEDSLIEITEEMRALYNPDEIQVIIACLTGFKSVFSIKQLQRRIQEYYTNTIWTSRLLQILEDLYRLGFIGNFYPSSQKFRWQHKGDDRIILSDEWRIMIHQALHSALSVGSSTDYVKNRKELPQTGDVVIATVNKVIPSFLLLTLKHYDNTYRGSVHISELCEEYVKDINSFASVGDEFRAKILSYDQKHTCWKVSFRIPDGIMESE